MSMAAELLREPVAAPAARRRRVAYFYRHMAEYIQIDLDLLAERHALTVDECDTRWPRPLLLLRRTIASDVVMSWFASWHSFWPVLLARCFGRKSIVVIGGYDTASLPDIGYGHWRDGGFRAWVARATMRLAHRLVAPSVYAKEEALGLGIPAGKIEVLPLGLDPARYPPCGVMREDFVITIGGVNRSNLERKGLESFVRAAALCPEREFVLVGAWMDDAIEHLRAIATPNVRFTGRVSHEEKARWLQRSRVVVQASRHESFGLSLVEGMLCGCVPVVTREGSLPEVTGGCGVSIDSAAPEELARGVRAAFELGVAAGLAARARVIGHFTSEARRRGLERLLDGHVRDGVQLRHRLSDISLESSKPRTTEG